MKIDLHPASSRGTADHGWLKTAYSFSFSSYYNPERIHFGALRVLNDDSVAAGMGFGKHPHDNMEIVTIPLKGALAHEDSTGTKGIVEVGDVQIMSAGSGLYHSEFNASQTESVELFQIWVLPKLKDISPRYDQRKYNPDEFKGQWKTIVAPLGTENDCLLVNQDTYFNLSELENETKLDYKFHGSDKGVFIMVIEGSIDVGNQTLAKRDAIAISETEMVSIVSKEAKTKVMLIEIPMVW